MSKNLIKLAQKLVDLANEAIETKKQESNLPPNKRDSIKKHINSVLEESKSTLTEYSQILNDISEEQKLKVKKVEIRRSEIKEFAKRQKLKTKEQKKYRIYQSNFYSKLSNFFMADLSFLIVKKYPQYFSKLSEELTLANIKILSRTYLSILLLTTLIAFPLATAIFFIITFKIGLALLVGLLTSLLTFFVLYKYPAYQKANRAKLIDSELVFAFFHMSAVASSGAHPIKVFKLLLDSKEYKNLNFELERILNYINVFGYNLTTSLKTVAKTTPSVRLKDFLYGMASTIETGGGIKEYLSSKAEDELGKSRLEQQKYSETVATFSEIYIGILIAAPLLFIVTLAILERISSDLAGIPISTLAFLGVFALLPLLNVLFIFLFEASKVGK